MKRASRRCGNVIVVSEDLPGGSWVARFHYHDGHEWSPPLPDDAEVARSSLGSPRGMIERLGGATTLGSLQTKQRPTTRTRTVQRDYRHVQLLDRGYVDYQVSLGSTAREQIIDEIKQAHHAAGQAVEAAGWLFGQYRPRADNNWTEVALVTRSSERPGTSGDVYLSDPFAAITAVRAAGYQHLELLGDWHSHTVRGSELPSLGDARAWAGTMDKLGRDAYLALIVSPSPEMGWMSPKFSAWVAGRVPSTPIVGRARLG